MFDQSPDGQNGASHEEPEVEEEEQEAKFAVLRSVSGDEVEVEQSIIQQVAGHDIEIEQSMVGLTSGENVALEQSASVLTVGRNVTVEGGATVFLLAPTVRGTVRTLFDVRSALALAVGYVAARQVVRLLGRLFEQDEEER
ncbi:MAG TPA: hypothetical protein VIO14_09270 [Dehalococcoidia bacterium]